MSAAHEFDERLRENAGFIATLCGGSAVIFLTQGDSVIAASDRGDDALEAFTRVRRSIDTNGAALGGGRHWWRETLELGCQRHQADVYVGCVVAQGSIASSAVAATDRVLAMVCRGIERDWSQLETIENLSVELGNRYEELNLLYGIDDSLAAPSGESVGSMVGTVLDNCLDFLSIDGAAIHVPGHDVEIYRFCDEARALLRFAAGDGLGALVHTQVLNSAGALVVNGTGTQPPSIGGERLPFRLLASPVFEGPQRIAGVLCFLRGLESEPFSTSDRKIAEVVAAEVSKALDARFDAVTGLLKRGPFEKLVQETWQHGARPDARAALVQIDLDRFTLINDACGHEAGDRLLRQAANAIGRFAPDEATVARLGADEYGVFLPDFDDEQARTLAEDVVNSLAGSRFVSREKSFEVTVSIGITELTADKPLSTALTEVDIACGLVKEGGGNRIRVYRSEDEHLQVRHEQMQWASKLRSAVDDRNFELFAQAIHPIAGPAGVPAHFEVLLRLFDDEGTVVSPAVFIPAAERYGLMNRIDRLVVRNAVEAFAAYQARGLEVGLSVNLSGPSITDPEFREFAIATVNAAGLRPGSLTFEITETAAISNLAEALVFIEALSAVGCCFSLDDFGSGMSSYAYLRTLPVDYVKIDGSFVRDMVDDTFNRSIVESIHQISRASGKRTIAEFVENQATLALLGDIGVDYAQGYVLDRPGPLAEKLEPLVTAYASAV